MSNPEQKEAPAAFVPPSQIDPAELSKAFQEDGIIETPEPAVEAAPVVAKEVPKQEIKPSVKEELPALARIAQERDAFRKEMEANKPHLEALRAIPPHTVSAIAKAIASGDPVSLLAAAGMTHAQYNARLLGAKDPEVEEKEAAPSGNKDIEALRQELAALKQERDSEKLQSSRSQMLNQMKEILKDSPKFETINGLEDFEGVERVLIAYHNTHGSLPGETLKESVELAAELYEAQLKKEAERWSKVLTKGQPPASVPSKAPESPSAGTVVSRTLTNANTSAPAVPRTVPKTRQEIIDALSSGNFADLET